MKNKQEILVNVLSAKLENAKVGVIVRGITDIDLLLLLTPSLTTIKLNIMFQQSAIA